MSTARKPFRREGEDRRRQDLLAAAATIVAESGIAGATVREIALRAGVTPGLIRHYFPGKDDLLRQAYLETMEGLTDAARQAIAGGTGPAHERLLAFVEANLTPPVANAGSLSIWAAFIAKVHAEPVFATIHRDTYLAFRHEIERLVAEVLGRPDRAAVVRLAIAINALIDGLWLEASLAPDLFGKGELSRAGRMAVEALLDGAITAREGAI